MSTTAVRRSDHTDAAERELSRWPGVSFTHDIYGKHYRLELTYGGQTRFVVFPRSSSDRRGALNHVRDIRSALTEMGAKRLPEPKAPAPRRRRNHTDPGLQVRADRLDRDPTRDPWAALASLKLAEPAPAAQPSPQQPWRRRFLSAFRSTWRIGLGG